MNFEQAPKPEKKIAKFNPDGTLMTGTPEEVREAHEEWDHQ